MAIEFNVPDYIRNKKALSWVKEMVELCEPNAVHWCDGSQSEYDGLISQMTADGTLTALAQPNSYLHRSNPNDVARTEHLTFICCENEADAGPTNNWLAPTEARAKLSAIFSGSMREMKLLPPPG